jgi:hypothetical protein
MISVIHVLNLVEIIGNQHAIASKIALGNPSRKLEKMKQSDLFKNLYTFF